jgi:transcriptional regulator with XRE-family HTH domain
MSVKITISAAQCRAARALVKMTQARLADAASVSKSVVVDFENDHRIPNRNNLAAIQRALEDAGVDFINGGSPGVRLRPG